MCKWWYWMEDCNIARASPASTDTSSDTTVWHDTILHTLTNLWGPPQLRGGDTTDNTLTHKTCKFYWADRYRIDVQLFTFKSGNWVNLSALDYSLRFICRGGISVISLMSWSFRLQCPRFVHKTDRSGGPGPPDRERISSEYYLAKLVFWRISSQIVTDHFTLTAHNRVKYQN